MSAACKGAGDLSGVAELKTQNLCRVGSPHGDSPTAGKPSADSSQSIAAPAALVLPGKANSRDMCLH